MLSCSTEQSKTALRRGFTLIELLVVIAIIAILAAILFPVFARARGKARQSSCQSNLKQIGLAIIQYQQDYDERTMPYGYDPVPPANDNAPFYYGWGHLWDNAATTSDPSKGLIQPYMKNGQIVECPDAPEVASNTAQTPPVAYAYNAHYLSSTGAGGVGGVGGGVNTSVIDAPAETILMTDGASLRTGGVYGRPGFALPPAWGSNPRIHGRHFGMANVLWADGHVKAMRVAFPFVQTESGVTSQSRELGSLVNPKFPFISANNGCVNLDLATAAATAECKADYYFMLLKPTS